MGNSFSYTKLIIWGVGIFVCLIGVVFALTVWIENKSITTLVAPANEIKKHPYTPSAFPTVPPKSVIIPDSNKKAMPVVHFRKEGFSPTTIIVEKKNTGVECLIIVYNESDETISIRLGPYEKGKIKGFSYKAIPPGDSEIIDPRYSGIAEPVFYNTANPKQEFMVQVNASCN